MDACFIACSRSGVMIKCVSLLLCLYLCNGYKLIYHFIYTTYYIWFIADSYRTCPWNIQTNYCQQCKQPHNKHAAEGDFKIPQLNFNNYACRVCLASHFVLAEKENVIEK